MSKERFNKSKRSATRSNRKNGSYNKPASKVEGTGNDVHWYFKDQQLMKDVASLSFYRPLGVPTGLNASPLERTVPGITVFNYIPTIGNSEDSSSAVNVAAGAIYSLMRNKNSGATNYDPCDYMMYVLSMDSPITYHSFLKRVYGTMMMYNIHNYYMPHHLITAMNVDFNDIKQHLADFRAYINQYAAKISQRAIPASIDLFTRHSWLATNIFKDSNSYKGQMYIFNPSAYYVWTEGEEEVPSLKYTPFAKEDNSLFTFADLVEFGDSLLNPILGSQDFATMSGDTIKAFGSTPGIWSVSTIDENYTVSISYENTAAMQIENMNAIPLENINASTLDITVDNSINKGLVLYNPMVSALSPYASVDYQPYRQGRYLNAHVESPDPGEVTEMTRLQLVIESDHIFCGSEIITDVFVYTLIGGNMLEKLTMPMIPKLKLSEAGGGITLDRLTQFIGVATKFDHFPIIYTHDGNQVYNTIASLDNYTVIEAVNVKNIHRAALMGCFGVPWNM